MFESQHGCVSRTDEGQVEATDERRVADGLLSELIVTKFNPKVGTSNPVIAL
ncbi:MAG TPA: hypothetical protein V6D35_18880 [Candidatus Sericytochromatia bacterium]